MNRFEIVELALLILFSIDKIAALSYILFKFQEKPTKIMICLV